MATAETLQAESALLSYHQVPETKFERKWCPNTRCERTLLYPDANAMKLTGQISRLWTFRFLTL
jgi:hypothetical protein